MGVYKVAYEADGKKYVIIIEASSENQVRKRMKRVFQEMGFNSGTIRSIEIIE